MGDYDDDFEDYADDFEPVTPIKPNNSKANSKDLKPSSKNGNAKEIPSKIESSKNKHSIETSHKSSTNARELPVDSPGSKYTGKFLSSISLGDSIGINSHLRRLATIHNSKVLDLQEERFNQLNILPTTVVDLYYRQLKGSAALNSKPSTTETETVTASATVIRQIGICTREETRDVEVNTEDIAVDDKEMQFSYGNDDTYFLNILRNIQNKIKLNGTSMNESSRKADRNGVVAIGEASKFSGISKLSTFLHKSSLLCELVLEENRVKAEENSKLKHSKSFGNDLDNLGTSVLDHNSSWLKMGEQERNGSLELIAFRKVNAIKFSPLQPNLIITSHPYPTDEKVTSNELRPFKGLLCVWDISSPNAPVYVLESSGQPTSCSFSSSQSFIVVAGMEDGSVSMWNLLESDSLHKDRDSKDLGVTRGIRKPCFTTLLSDVLTAVESENSIHFAAVAQIDSLGYGVVGQAEDMHYSQFVSIDITGKVIFWMTQQVSDASVSADDFADNRGNLNLGLSPWSNLMLVSTRSLFSNRVIDDFLLNSTDGVSTNEINGKSNQKQSKSSQRNISDFLLEPSSIPSSKCILGIVPNDMSTIYLSYVNGRVQRLSRYHSVDPSESHPNSSINTLNPSYYTINTRSSDGTMSDWIVMSVSNDKNTFSAVTSVSVQESFSNYSDNNDKERKQESESKESKTSEEHSKENTTRFLGKSTFILVGRENGCISLYSSNDDDSFLLHTWNTADLQERLSGGFSKPSSIIYLKWCPMRASSFFALTLSGNLIYFDMLLDHFLPLFQEKLPSSKDAKDKPKYFDICVPKYSSSYLYLAVNFKNKYGINSIQVHKLSNSSVKLCKSTKELVEEDKALRHSLSNWAGRAPQ